jgi:dipeptidase E
MQHVVAMGSGGFLGNESTTPLDEYVLSLVASPRPRVCFVPTASGDTPERVKHFHDVFDPLDCEATHLSLFWRDETPVADHVANADVVYVDGGNTANLHVIWRLHGLDRALADRSAAGDLVVCGPSAGGLCWFECGVTDSFGPQLGPLDDGMGWIAGSFCPHYDEEPRRKPVYRGLVGSGRLPAGIAADGGVGLHYVDGELHAVVSERPNATAYRLTARDGSADEVPLDAKPL